MLRRLLINEQPSFASIGYSDQQLSPVPRGTANRRSQFHCPKSKISKVWFALEEDKKYGLGPYLKLVLYTTICQTIEIGRISKDLKGFYSISTASFVV